MPAMLLRFPISIVADLVAENPDVLASLLFDLHMRLNTLHGRLATAEGRAARRSGDQGGSDRLSSTPLLAVSLYVGTPIGTEQKELA